MDWSQVDRYYMQSDLGYTISKSFSPDGFRYAAWPPKDGGTARALLYTNDLAAAKAACAQHAGDLSA